MNVGGSALPGYRYLMHINKMSGREQRGKKQQPTAYERRTTNIFSTNTCAKLTQGKPELTYQKSPTR